MKHGEEIFVSRNIRFICLSSQIKLYGGRCVMSSGQIAMTARGAARRPSADSPRCMDFLFRNLKASLQCTGAARADLYSTIKIYLKVLTVRKDFISI